MEALWTYCGSQERRFAISVCCTFRIFLAAFTYSDICFLILRFLLSYVFVSCFPPKISSQAVVRGCSRGDVKSHSISLYDSSVTLHLIFSSQYINTERRHNDHSATLQPHLPVLPLHYRSLETPQINPNTHPARIPPPPAAQKDFSLKPKRR